MKTNNIFISGVHFPRSVIMGDKSFNFFKTLKDYKKLIVVSASFNNSNKDWMDFIFSEKEEYFIQQGEPTRENYNELKEKITNNNFNYLVALGGGSVIDLVKLIAMDLNLPIVVIPTTIGSGAEASKHALIIEENIKQVRSSLDLLPETVLLNPRVLMSLTREQVIYGAIDALAHGLESLTSRISNDLADNLALLAVDKIYEELSNFSKGIGNNDVIITQLQMAGFWAGLAQSSTGTGLTHALAHYWGGRKRINHTKLVATFLLDVLDLNLSHTDKYSKLKQSKKLSESNFVGKLKDLFVKLEVKSEKIKNGGDLEEVAKLIRRDGLTLNNPYYPTVEEIKKLMEKNVN